MKLLFHLLTVILFFLHNGVSGVETDEVSVMEGDSVTIYTHVTIEKKEEIILYFNKSQIANITRCMREIYIDAECKERFRDRLKLDHQTGSLTIRDIRTTDSGEYELQIRNHSYDKTFNVTVNGVSAKQDKRNTSVEGESVTLDHGQIKIPYDLMRWHFNEILIAEITGDQSKICTDVLCDERFRDRLKLDNQTGSLTITNTRTTDSGDYKLFKKNSIFSIIRTFSVVVVAVPDSSWFNVDICIIVGAVSIIVVAGFLLGVGVVMCYYKIKRAQEQQNPTHPNAMPLLERNPNEAGVDGEAREAGEAHEAGTDGEAREDGEAEDADMERPQSKLASKHRPGREEEAQREIPLTTLRGPGAVKHSSG